VTGLAIRKATAADAAALAGILNPIILAGGTTGIEDVLDPPTLAHWFIDGPDVITCHLAEAGGLALGFQSLSRYGDLPPGWADIGTFARQPRRGTGSALFAATLAAARTAGIISINATIRADNTGGLVFYRRLGFVPYRTTPAVPLRDGTPVDRLHHRLDP
jgi:L-amino acid N-acyltransferase YncA